MNRSDELQPTLEVVNLGRSPAGQPPLLATRQLFRHGNTLRIEHAGQCYLLRITRENKLILTK
jgi:hemin uptake protein HemP